MGAVSSFYLVVCFSEKGSGVVALYLSNWPLKPCSGLEPILNCKLSTYKSISQWLSHCAIEYSNLALCYGATSDWPCINRVIIPLCPCCDHNICQN